MVVTYNRLSLLQECIAAVRAQTRPPDEIIVVDNASTDGSAEWLAAQPGLTVITQKNEGSSGGQYTGIKTAYQNGHDWFWCMDDDTIPERAALAQLLGCPYATLPDTGFLGSLVLAPDGKLFGTTFLIPTHTEEWCQTVTVDHCVRVTVAPFVSLLVARRAVERVGLPLRELFLLYDDAEFCRRISEHFRGYCALDSRVLHKSSNAPLALSARNYPTKYLYAIRNEIAYVRSSRTGRSAKLITIMDIGYRVFRDVLLRRKPARAVRWYFAGLFMNTRPDFPPAKSPTT